MENILKTFKFESENIILFLDIKKEISGAAIKMIISARIENKNPNVIMTESFNSSSYDIHLKYKTGAFFYIGSNDWKGVRWEKSKNESKYNIYRNISEMKEAYIKQREFITVISSYFYDSIKKFKELQLLYETPLEDIISEENL